MTHPPRARTLDRRVRTAAAPQPWDEDPQAWFPCPTCEEGLHWAELDHGVLLECGNRQCFTAGIPVPIWLAQQHRENRGLDQAVSDAGWPRPVRQGRPVPYLTPVTAGHPWWRLTHGRRLLACQNDWLCQVCGLDLEPAAWVLVDESGAVDSDAALHRRCLDLATATCPHLISAAPQVRAVLVTRAQLYGDSRPLTAAPAIAAQRWSLVPS